ncbi:MAG: ATP-dependent DNA helicase [Acidobacteria bacterium]|nr:ATP-dependent DNA helicase [Acidobacteriota bacterium]
MDRSQLDGGPLGLASSLPERVDSAFASDGVLSQALPAFEARDSQRRMAVGVAEIFECGGVLLAEAGTGIGKTLAYLVPAILSGHRVLVSTGTKQLQDQIYYKDLPALRDALQTAFTATYMKGRGNYLCLHRFDAYRTGDALRTATDEGYLDDISEWARQTETGDRTEIEDLPDDLPFWGDISATSENCVGTDCPQYDECFVTKMRRQAAESDLVIVNHHLLCADAAVRQSAYGEVIPACHYAVIDEAHQLEDVATQYFGVSVSTYRLERLVGDTTRYLDRDLRETPEAADRARAGLDGIERLSVLFFGAVQRHLPTADRTRLDADALAPVMELGRQLASAVRALEDTLAPLADQSEDLRSLARRARELSEHIDFVLGTADVGFVYFLERRGRGLFLRASPVDVSSIIRELLLERMQATVLTSATLAVDESFEYQRSRLGIRHAAELRLASEFDYANQTVLFLPADMPEPRAPDFTRCAAHYVTALLEATQGRAFVLFTSYANLRQVHQLVAPHSRFPLLVQGTAPRSVLLRNFRATPNAVLLATSSFWQGVDVAGDALSCVIIDKLPFTPPGDPITAARMDAIARDGGSPFSDYQVPLAILTLLQGVGRLIRHRQDRGVLSILDPRVLTKAYGRRFLASLPPSPIVREVDAVQAFLARKGM